MSEPNAPRGMNTNLSPKIIAAGLLGVGMLLFWAANRRVTRVSFLFFDATVRVWVALLVASLFGFVLGFLLARQKRDA